MMNASEIYEASVTQARESTKALREQGWQGDGSTYNLGAYPGDLEAFEARIGGKADREDVARFERHVREMLSTPAPVEVLDGMRPYQLG
jgi:hypothetical protein